MEKKTTLFSLYWDFVQIGALTFGGRLCHAAHARAGMRRPSRLGHQGGIGGLLCHIPMHPGIIAVNTATFIGSKHRGSLGAAAATLGVVTPSLVIILLIAPSWISSPITRR